MGRYFIERLYKKAIFTKPEKDSLLNVNERFEGERNNKMTF